MVRWLATMHAVAPHQYHHLRSTLSLLMRASACPHTAHHAHPHPQEAELLCNLLEWFNRPTYLECEMYDEVCTLLALFAEYPSAATTLVEIGKWCVRACVRARACTDSSLPSLFVHANPFC
jgi:hypothetical protein